MSTTLRTLALARQLHQHRLQRVARALGFTPTDNLRLERADHKDGNGMRWWLCGAVEGDQALPRTRNLPTAREALEAAEAWLAPELESLEHFEQFPMVQGRPPKG